MLHIFVYIILHVVDGKHKRCDCMTYSKLPINRRIAFFCNDSILASFMFEISIGNVELNSK